MTMTYDNIKVVGIPMEDIEEFKQAHGTMDISTNFLRANEENKPWQRLCAV